MAADYNTPSPAHIRVRDPLSEVTRKERRALLAAALLGVAISQTGLLPTEISALGVTFGSTDQKALLIVLATVTGYFLLAFVIYAASDFVAWRLALRQSLREAILKRRPVDPEEEQLDRDFAIHYKSLNAARRWSPAVSVARSLFEFLLP